MAKKQKRSATEVDFTDEDAVLRAVAKDLGEDPDDLSIKEEKGLTSFGKGTVYRISTSGGHRAWCVAENDDAARSLALVVVTLHLERELETFEESFLESHIDQDSLRRYVEIAGMDVAAAAEDAVDIDGWERFLCPIDGDSLRVGDLVYWREK